MEEEIADQDFPDYVVGIGASAGGLEAIERFFDAMPDDTGMAFVVVQHLSPDYKSLMSEVLSRWTTLPIHRVKDGMPVRRNSIYLIPPKKEMIISNHRLLLKDKDPSKTLSLPIDLFFRSLGQDCGRQGVAIVLSGTGSDGSRGIVDVHASGGLVIVQSPETAKFDGMPHMAEKTGVADLVAAPEEMPDALQRFANDPRFSLDPALLDPTSLDNHSLDETGLKQVFTLIRDTYGLDFSHYKLSTVVRRTERRLSFSNCSSVDEYVAKLRQDPDELNQLYRDLLVNVTRFFRDSEAFDRLQQKVIADLVSQAREDSEIRVWAAGCATGEEAYSLAILIDEALTAAGKHLQVKIFATDVHRGSLQFASYGVYSEAALEGLSKERISRYFQRTSGGFQVSTSLRQMVVFAPHNLVKDAPFTKLDLVSCRNLLIYLQPRAQQKVFSQFHFGLKTGAALLLGPSEVVGDLSDEFETVDAEWKIFRKCRSSRLPPEMRQGMNTGLGHETPTGVLPADLRHAGVNELLTMSTYDALLEMVMPPALLVSTQGELLHTFGDAGKYLRPESGRHTADIRDRLIDDLRSVVSSVINRVMQNGGDVHYTGIPVQHEAITGLHNVTASLVHDPRNKTRTILLQIQASDSTSKDTQPSIDAGSFDAQYYSTIESELRYTKESLQSTIEKLETSNEELQATNEELVASNEELQSTNEELHSVNQELYTVNAEHQNKIVQLSEVTRDIDNLLESTEVDTIFLDADLRIRKFTPRVAQRFNFLPQDIGRPFDAFTHSFDSQDIAAKIRRVLTTEVPYEEEVRDEAGNCFFMRILPYQKTVGKKQEGPTVGGALMTLFDITKLKDASDALAESLEQRDNFLAMLSHELRNPLATILNATHLLTTDDEAEADSPAAIIKRQSRQMAALLDDLLDVTRVSQGNIQLQRRPFNFIHVVQRAVEGVGLTIQPRQQQIITELPDEPVWINGSEPRMLQVITNLLTNASKYSGLGDEIRLTVAVDGEVVEMHVLDQGVGILAEQIDKIFDLFVQSNRTLDRADGGLGVGLTLVKSLVALHGGQVTAHSEGVGLGSDFCVRIPTCEQPTPCERADNTPENGGEIRRLVLVEDNLDACKMLAFLLEDAGYEVSIAHDGKQGLELIKTSYPDAAIIDVGLPEMNGYDVATAVRSDSSCDAIHLLAVTGYGQERDREMARKAGFDEHLVKPVDPAVLSDLLQRMARSVPQRLERLMNAPLNLSRASSNGGEPNSSASENAASDNSASDNAVSDNATADD